MDIFVRDKYIYKIFQPMTVLTNSKQLLIKTDVFIIQTSANCAVLVGCGYLWNT